MIRFKQCHPTYAVKWIGLMSPANIPKVSSDFERTTLLFGVGIGHKSSFGERKRTIKSVYMTYFGPDEGPITADSPLAGP
jgi:hypothetical protein